MNSLEDKDLTQEEIVSIEEEVTSMDLYMDSDRSGKYWSKKCTQVLSFVMKHMELVSQGHCMGLGLTFGASLGTSIGVFIAELGMAIAIGTSIGLVIGVFIRKSFGANAMKEDRVLMSI